MAVPSLQVDIEMTEIRVIPVLSLQRSECLTTMGVLKKKIKKSGDVIC